MDPYAAAANAAAAVSAASTAASQGTQWVCLKNGGYHRNSHITIWLFNIAMENGQFIDDFPIKTSIYKGSSIAMLNNQMVVGTMMIKPVDLGIPYFQTQIRLMNWLKFWKV